MYVWMDGWMDGWMLTSFIMQTTQLMYVVQSIYFLKHYAVLSFCLKLTHCSMNDWSGLTKLSFPDLGPSGSMSCSSPISIKSLILNWLFSLPRCLAIPHKSYYLYVIGWLISNCPKTRSRISKRPVSLSHMSMSVCSISSPIAAEVPNCRCLWRADSLAKKLVICLMVFHSWEEKTRFPVSSEVPHFCGDLHWISLASSLYAFIEFVSKKILHLFLKPCWLLCCL